MSKQELVDKTNSYLEKLPEDNLEEIFHFVEFIYTRYRTPLKDKKDKFMELLLNGPVWSEEDEKFFQENSLRIRQWRTI